MPKAHEQRVPVIIQLNADRLQHQLGVLDDLSDPATLARLVRRGLRAQLQTKRYATGTTFVELEYHPLAPAPAPTATPIDDLPEIPTIPSTAVASLQKIQDIALWLPTYDFRSELSQINDSIDSFTTKVDVIPYAEYHQQAVDAFAPLANFNLGPWQRNFNNFLTRLHSYQDSLTLAKNQFSASAQDFVAMNHEARAELSQTNDVLAAGRANLRPDAPWLAHLTHNLQALSADMANLTAKLNATEQQPDVLPKIPK